MKKNYKYFILVFVFSLFLFLTSCKLDKINFGSNKNDDEVVENNNNDNNNEDEQVLYKLNFELNGGEFLTSPSTTFVNFNSVVLPTPTKETCKFLGWYENDVLIDSINENRDYNLIAKWENGIEIIYTNVSNEKNVPNLGYSGTNSPLNKEYFFASDFNETHIGIRSTRSKLNDSSITLYNAQLSGFYFNHWLDSLTDEEVNCIDKNYVENHVSRYGENSPIILIADWSPIENTIILYYDETYDDVVTSCYYNIEDILNNTVQIDPYDLVDDVNKLGYFFVGWYFKGTNTKFVQFSVHDFRKIELYPKWVEQIGNYTTLLTDVEYEITSDEYYMAFRSDGGIQSDRIFQLTDPNVGSIASLWVFKMYWDLEENTYKAALIFDSDNIEDKVLDMTHVETFIYDGVPYSIYKFKLSDNSDGLDLEAIYGRTFIPLTDTLEGAFLVQKIN